MPTMIVAEPRGAEPAHRLHPSFNQSWSAPPPQVRSIHRTLSSTTGASLVAGGSVSGGGPGGCRGVARRASRRFSRPCRRSIAYLFQCDEAGAMAFSFVVVGWGVGTGSLAWGLLFQGQRKHQYPDHLIM